jgi:hypothetical protein
LVPFWGDTIVHQIPIQEILQGIGTVGTGATTWESSLVMALYFGQHLYPRRLGHVLEIGAGVGVGAVLLSHVLSHHRPYNDDNVLWNDHPWVSSITLTDGSDACVQQCRTNIRQAWSPTLSTQVQVSKLDWNDDDEEDGSTMETKSLHTSRPTTYDTIIACDVCYLYDDIEALSRTIQRRLKQPQGVAHLFGPYNRGAFQYLIERLGKDMDVTVEYLGLQRYRMQPLTRDFPFSPPQQRQNSWYHPSTDDDSSQLDEQRRYASTSQATILHVVVRHRPIHNNDSSCGNDNHNLDLRDID